MELSKQEMMEAFSQSVTKFFEEHPDVIKQAITEGVKEILGGKLCDNSWDYKIREAFQTGVKEGTQAAIGDVLNDNTFSFRTREGFRESVKKGTETAFALALEPHNSKLVNCVREGVDWALGKIQPAIIKALTEIIGKNAAQVASEIVHEVNQESCPNCGAKYKHGEGHDCNKP